MDESTSGATQRRGRLRSAVNGEEIGVPSVVHLKCPQCCEIVLRFLEAKRLHQDAIALYRRKHGLLSADEIRAIREHLGLTQASLSRLLRLGANTVSRWESGRNVQTAAMDILLRLIRDLREASITCATTPPEMLCRRSLARLPSGRQVLQSLRPSIRNRQLWGGDRVFCLEIHRHTIDPIHSLAAQRVPANAISPR